MRRVEARRTQLASAIEEAKWADDKKYQQALKDYAQELSEWEKMTELAGKILADDPEAHLEAIQEVNPFRTYRRWRPYSRFPPLVGSKGHDLGFRYKDIQLPASKAMPHLWESFSMIETSDCFRANTATRLPGACFVHAAAAGAGIDTAAG